MSVYFQLCGTGLCMQTRRPGDSCPRSKREDGAKQFCARSGPHTIAGAAPLPSCGHAAPFLLSCPSACQLPASPWLLRVTSPCRPLPLAPHGPLSFWEQPGAHKSPAWQNPREGRSRQ